MVGQFAVPVLSVTTDAVKDLQGEAAVFGLWNVFTKCKDSLPEGQRLENISWRLWHREISTHHSVASPTSSSATTPSLERDMPLLISPSPSPVSDESTESSSKGLPSVLSLPPKNSESAEIFRSAPSRRPLPVGRIIFSQILPEKLSTLLPKKRPAADSKVDNCAVLPEPLTNIPAVVYPSTPPSGTYPKVVIVNPTPHPTPPATPLSTTHLFYSNSVNHPHLQASQSATSKSGHLAPPFRSPALTVIKHEQAPITPTPPKHQQSSSPSEVLTHLRSASAKPIIDDAPKFASGSVLQPRFFLKESPEHGDSSPDRESCARDVDTFTIAGDASSQADSSIVGKSLSSEKAASSLESPKVNSAGSRTAAAQFKRSAVTTGTGVGTGAAPRRKPGHQIGARPTRPANHRVNSRYGQKKSKSSTNVAAAVAPTATILTMNRTTSSKGETRTARTASVDKKSESLSSRRSHEIRNAPPSPPSHAPATGRPTMQRKPSERSTSHASGTRQQQRRGIVVDNSTDYETTDSDDDSEWASVDVSPAEDRANRRKTKKQHEEVNLRRRREAEEEDKKQWEKDMFAKLPRTSYTQLPEKVSGLSSGPGPRTRSVGLLSQLLNPAPSVLPANHAYRTFSTQDMTQFSRVSGLSMSRSSAAAPLASRTTAHVPTQNGDAHGKESGGGKYRPRGRPEGAEMDDDSEEDENKLEVSTSLAQQKLAALASPNRRRRRPEEPIDQRQLPPGGPPEHQVAVHRPTLTSVATAPIPLSHPYNLPAPAPPSTPRTTRRQMLATELSESLRRNLLWERQISKVGSGGPRRRNGGILGAGGLRPLTSMDAPPSAEGGNNNGGGTRSGDETMDGREDPKEERRRRALARNKSWADDYHYSGW